jgi:outer membrane lipoprotein SlyB
MKKIALLAAGFLMLSGQCAFAGTKTLVEYGTVQQSQIVRSGQTSHPLRTMAAGAVGGAIGHQFGSGNGNTAMTIAGAAAGAGISHNRQSKEQSAQTVNLLIKTNSGQLIEVSQPYNGSIIFNKGDKVRILTSGSDTSVDKNV